MIFKVFSLLLLLVFYGIYFVKMYTQKKKGIQTRQIGKCKDKEIRVVEVLMSIATGVIVPVQLISIFLDLHSLNMVVRWFGVVFGFVGDIVFLLAVLTMKDSWRAGIPSEDKTSFVSTGIYRISRNPAFVGFDLMYIGICLIYGNIFTVLCTIFAIVMLHFQILQEEKFLEQTFGSEYKKYKRKVFRYLGRSKLDLET